MAVTKSFIALGLTMIFVSGLSSVSIAATGESGKGQGGDPFANVRQGSVRMDNGVPKLLINGKEEFPLIFFFNTCCTPEQREKYLGSQVKMAGENNIHLYSMDFVGWPWVEEGEKGEGNFSSTDQFLDAFIKADPKATFILRFYDTAPGGWKGSEKVPEDELTHYADGTTLTVPSLASAYNWKNFQKSMTRMIRRYEASVYGSRILAYHACGQTEWFALNFQDKGPDCSPANLRAFRAWLKNRYKSDAALAKAWNKPGLTFATVGIPKVTKGRFPIHNAHPGEMVQAFYDPKNEYDWVDFSRFISESTSQRVMDIAKLIKKETGGKKMTIFFFGYNYELPSSINGQLDSERLLHCPDVDMLASPLSYGDRLAGGSAFFMSAVDSITAHGKLWINEDDTRTSVMDHEYHKINYGIETEAKDLAETSNFMQRNLAALLVHRTGTWWMDLSASGAFNEASLWKMLDERGRSLYSEIYKHPTPYRPEVAVIMDPSALYHVKSDWDVPANSLSKLRDESAKTGAQIGYYFLNDFIDGKIPQCKVYVFANTFYLTNSQVQAIQRRLDREKATALWQFAPGYLGPKGTNVQQSSSLTGIQLAVEDGRLESDGEGALKGIRWGWHEVAPDEIHENIVSPRLTVADKSAEVLGHYVVDNKISTARKKVGQHTSVFCGDFRMSSEMMKKIFKEAGVHIWTDGREVIHTDGNILMVHSGQAGVRRIYPPAGKKLEAIGGQIESQDANSASVLFTAGASRWFKVVPR